MSAELKKPFKKRRKQCIKNREQKLNKKYEEAGYTGKTKPQTAVIATLPCKKKCQSEAILAFTAEFMESNDSWLRECTKKVFQVAASFPKALAGLNGADFVNKAENCFTKNAFCYAVIQAMKPGQRFDPDHCDGGASILHMGITIFGERKLIAWLGPTKSAACGAVPAQTNDLEEHKFHQQPGKVYIGNLCAVRHQVEHLPLAQAGQLSNEGHLMTVMLRSDYFRWARSRKLEGKPAPTDLYRACLG